MPAEVGSAPPRPAAGAAFRWVKIGFGLAGLAFGGLFVARRWADIRGALVDLGAVPVVVAVPLGAAGVYAAMLAWRALLADLGHPLSLRDGGRVYFLSQLGKYVPGSVWAIVAQVELGHELRVPRTVSAATSLLALALSELVGLGVATMLLPFGAAGTLRRYWWLAAVPVLAAALLRPRTLTALLNLLLRVVRRQPLEVALSGRGMLVVTGWLAVSWLLIGLHCYVLVLGYTARGGGLRELPLAVGGMALAYCLGVLAVPAPAGVGIREAVLGLVLTRLLTAPQVITVVLVSRVGLLLVDFALAGLWSLHAGRRRSKAS